ncbi:hypothetical protein ACFQ0M_45520 [Kitasatospora aburaviensis]
MPALAPRYADRPADLTTLDELAALPPLVKDDLNVALAHLEPRAATGATWLFQSGGSTGAPRSATRPPASTWPGCTPTGSRSTATTPSSTPGAPAGCGAHTSLPPRWPTWPAAG